MGSDPRPRDDRGNEHSHRNAQLRRSSGSMRPGCHPAKGLLNRAIKNTQPERAATPRFLPAPHRRKRPDRVERGSPGMIFAKAAAVLKRDIVTSLRYRSGFFFKLVSPALQLASFYYLARAVGPQFRPGRPGELHPEPPTDPDVNLSIHPARATQRRLPPSIKTRRSSGYPLTPSRRG